MRRFRQPVATAGGGSPSDVTEHEPGAKRGLILTLMAVGSALLPLVVAAARAIRHRWLPVGDNAYFLIRARDVLTEHQPLLGTWTSVSFNTGTNVNNLGPLHFELLAGPTKLLGGANGLAVGAALVNGLSIVGIAVFAHRRGGPLLTTLAMAMTAALGWAMGSELLYDPWQPHNILLPFLFFIVLVWSLTCGDPTALPWGAAIGSVVLQTHLSYSIFVPALAVWGVAGLLLALRRRRRDDPDAWPAQRRWAQRAGGIAVIVGVLCWAQSIVEQFTSDGPGNITGLVTSLGEDPARNGYAYSARLMATVVALPPAWLRPSFGDAWIRSLGAGRAGGLPDPPSLALALPALGVLVAVLLLAAWVARRRDHETLLAVSLALFLLFLAFVTGAQAPISTLGLAPHQYRWLWPVAAFASFAVLATLARRLAASDSRRHTMARAFTVTAAVLMVLNLAANNQRAGPNSDQYAIAGVRELDRDLARLDRGTPLLVDNLSFGPIFDPYGTAVMASLQGHGIPFVVKDANTLRQLGPSRRFTGTNARTELLLRHGDGVRTAPIGSHRIALSEALSAVEQRELTELRDRITALIERSGLTLNRAGREASAKGELAVLRRQLQRRSIDPSPLFASRELVRLGRDRLLLLEDTWADRLARYAELQERWDRQTVALFLRPLT